MNVLTMTLWKNDKQLDISSFRRPDRWQSTFPQGVELGVPDKGEKKCVFFLCATMTKSLVSMYTAQYHHHHHQQQQQQNIKKPQNQNHNPDS